MPHPIKSIASNIITYLEEQGLIDELPNLIATLQQEVDRKLQITVISADPLSTEDKHSVTKRTQAAWGEHPISFMIDPLLVTGIIVRFRDQVIDLSAHSRITDLKAHLV